MIFSTYWFLCAVVLFLTFYAIADTKLRTLLLIVFCAVFHTHFAGPAGVLPIVVLGALVYLSAFVNRKMQTLAMIVCVAALIYYKYSGFIWRDIFHHVIQSSNEQLFTQMEQMLPAAVPLAISFFVFEFVHYLWDVRSGTPKIDKPFTFLQFAIFFPSLVAGPIKRYENFIPALESGKASRKSQDLAQGFVQVAGGFFKKVVLADNLTLYINAIAPRLAYVSQFERWIFLLALSFRIYFDFSGYSDIAIGLARMMGIELPINFNWPYVARNMQDFWRRWHISLSTWIRDYIYIPLGGSREGRLRTVSNGIVAFALCGLWHGAAWNFLCWGIYHGIGLTVASTYKNNSGALGVHAAKVFDKLPVAAWFVTFLYVSLGWLLFFYPVGEALTMGKLLFVPQVLK